MQYQREIRIEQCYLGVSLDRLVSLAAPSRNGRSDFGMRFETDELLSTVVGEFGPEFSFDRLLAANDMNTKQ